tara:strand:- start:95 stop:292 length:198 start_codon:yes stop_codon:yes gene_type:complete
MIKLSLIDIENLIKIANLLDSDGEYRIADKLDDILIKNQDDEETYNILSEFLDEDQIQAAILLSK